MTNVVHKFLPTNCPEIKDMSARDRRARAIGSRQIRNLHTQDGRQRSKYLDKKIKQLLETKQ